MDIKINQAILHILDSTATLPVYSSEGLELYDEKIQDFIGKHVERIFEDQGVKLGRFVEDSDIKELIQDADEDFTTFSISIAEILYKLMQKYMEIPPGDLLISLLKSEIRIILLL